MLRYRVALPTDHDDIIDLYQASVYGLGDDYYTDQQLDAWAAFPDADSFPYRDDTHFIAVVQTDVDDIPLAGMTHFNTDTGALLKHYVHPDYARQGIGTRLLQYVERTAIDADCQTIVLDATLAGVPLYKEHGYHEVEEFTKHIPYKGRVVAIEQVMMQKETPARKLDVGRLDERPRHD